jgi:hypothetical protein
MPPAAQSCCTAAQSLDEPDGLAEGLADVLAEGLTDVLGPPQPVMSAAERPSTAKNFMAPRYYVGGCDRKSGHLTQGAWQGECWWAVRGSNPRPPRCKSLDDPSWSAS